ncbi:glycoside hydrolase family 25 protein [Limoniibacter endophyticus]|uniref:Glycoside hydrolase n=1 Tax=Limoniibacter endophyticus TaxID=1565040 RepID=A0A8J3DTI3_9HYPH|nr:GH25 family lysozyme [Limoniibacter endophyticus]GHC75110.1 glycoside hydrolase [Limoniibacter endophyticus]
MRWTVALLAASLVAGCTTADVMQTASLSPSSTRSSTTHHSVGLAYPRFEDSKPWSWGKHKPHAFAVHGTDVSKYQRSVDWTKAKASGISFAFIKATEGGDRVDDYFAENWRGAKAAGIPRSAYHFYYFCRTAREQAEWYIRNVPKEAASLPPVLDMEWNPLSPSCKLRPSPEKVRAEMKIFLDIVERHYGKKPIIYTSVDFFDDNKLGVFKDYPFWLRSVAGHPTEKYGDHPFVFWQYTGTGIVPGITGDADINVFNGSQSSWAEWLSRNTG